MEKIGRRRGHGESGGSGGEKIDGTGGVSESGVPLGRFGQANLGGKKELKQRQEEGAHVSDLGESGFSGKGGEGWRGTRGRNRGKNQRFARAWARGGEGCWRVLEG